MSEFRLEYNEIGKLSERIVKLEGNTEGIINDVLHNKSFAPLTEAIIQRIHPSDRKWKGKKKPSKSTQPFRQLNGNLYIEIKSKKTYHYLYFPDDGSNTIHHAGNQRFMTGGVEKKADYVKNMITKQLIRQIEEG